MQAEGRTNRCTTATVHTLHIQNLLRDKAYGKCVLGTPLPILRMPSMHFKCCILWVDCANAGALAQATKQRQRSDVDRRNKDSSLLRVLQFHQAGYWLLLSLNGLELCLEGLLACCTQKIQFSGCFNEVVSALARARVCGALSKARTQQATGIQLARGLRPSVSCLGKPPHSAAMLMLKACSRNAWR